MEHYEVIAASGEVPKRLPDGLLELYLNITDGRAFQMDEKLTEKNLRLLLKYIRRRKTMEAYLWLNSSREGDYFNIETNPSWIAFQYVVNDGEKDGYFCASLNADYLDSDEESETDTIYGGFMPMRYTMRDAKLAAKCVEYFARTGELYPGMTWIKVFTG